MNDEQRKQFEKLFNEEMMAVNDEAIDTVCDIYWKFYSGFFRVGFSSEIALDLTKHMLTSMTAMAIAQGRQNA